MPKIYEYLGFIFFFYSNEHLPVHCHVRKGQKEAKAELEYVEGSLSVKFLKVKGKEILQGDDIERAENFIRKKHIQIVQKWNTYFIYGKSPKFEKINKKI